MLLGALHCSIDMPSGLPNRVTTRVHAAGHVTMGFVQRRDGFDFVVVLIVLSHDS